MIAEISKDRYRVFMGELSSRANISTASTKPQSGHMQTDINRDGSHHVLNLRVEMVPTLYGQDAVLRLFNFDESLLNLDLLGITEAVGTAPYAQSDADLLCGICERLVSVGELLLDFGGFEGLVGLTGAVKVSRIPGVDLKLHTVLVVQILKIRKVFESLLFGGAFVGAVDPGEILRL